MKKLFILCISLASLMSCDDNDNRKIVQDPKALPELKKDTSTIEIADLPILLDSTNYLIHPIGFYKTENRYKLGSYSSSSSDYDDGFGISVSRGGDVFSVNNLTNVSFQHIDSTELMPLTDKIIRITEMSFLKDVYKNSGKTVIIYEVRDFDTNNDQKLDYGDVRTLYISNIDGSNFTKLLPDFEDLREWKTILANNRLYFNSVEDTNKNGEFDKKDNMHYYTLDLNVSDFKPTEYFPLPKN